MSSDNEEMEEEGGFVSDSDQDTDDEVGYPSTFPIIPPPFILEALERG